MEAPKIARPTLRRATVILGTLAGLAVLLLGGIDLYRDGVEALAEAERSSRATGRLLAGQTEAILRAADQSLLRIQESVRGDPSLLQPDNAEATRLFKTVAAQVPFLRGYLLVDAEGQVLSGSVGRTAVRFNIADRDYFQFHRNHSGADLHVSSAYRGRQSGRATFALSRRFNDSHGRFAGIVVVAIETEDLERLYAKVDQGSGTLIALTGSDGAPVVNVIGDQAQALADQPGRPDYAAVLAAVDSGKTRLATPPDQRLRIVGAHRLLDDRLTLAVGIALTDIFATWRVHALNEAIIMLIGAIGIAVGAMLLLRQIAMAERLQERLTAESDRAEQYLTISEAIIIDLDGQARITRVNRRGCDLLGHPESELIGRDWFELATPIDLRSTLRRNFDAIGARAVAPPTHFEHALLDGHGERRVIAWSALFLWDEQERFRGCLTSGLDVTERRRTEESLKDREVRFRDLVETTSDRLWEVDRRGHYSYVSPKVAEILGYRPEEVVGHLPFDFMPADKIEAAKNAFQPLMRARQPFLSIENENLTRDGEHIVLETSGVPFFDAAGRFLGYRGIDRDITARKKAEHLVQRQREVLDLLRDIAATANLTQSLREVLNAALTRLRAHTTWPLSGAFIADPERPGDFRPLAFAEDSIDPRFAEWIEATHRIVFDNSRGLPGRVAAERRPLWVVDVSAESWFLRGELARRLGIHTGFAFPVLVRDEVVAVLELFSTERIAPDPVILQVLDQIGVELGRVAERERVTASLLHAKEMAEASSRAKSEFLATMSHELRTPLNAIIGFSDTIVREIFGPETNRHYAEYARAIHDSGQHLLQLINDILDVSAIEVGRLNLHLGAVNVQQTIDAALRLVRPRAEQGRLTLTTDIAVPLPSISADERRIKQILINLLTNAIKFTPEGGAIGLRAYHDADRGELIVEVRDTGIGMDEAGVAKAMTPFGQVDSSLARRYEGTGLGLPLTRGLTEAHGGHLTIISRPGAGTTVRIRLPAPASAAG